MPRRLGLWIAGPLVALMHAVATPAAATELALLLGNATYNDNHNIGSGTAIVDAVGDLQEAGVAVVARDEVGARAIQRAVAQFEQLAPSAESVLIALTGRFVTSGQETWFLPVDADAPTLAGLPQQALPLSTALTILGHAADRGAGKAILLLGTDRSDGRIGRYLREGVGDLDLPPGVTLVSGAPVDIARVLRGTLARPGARIADAVAADRALRLDGYRDGGAFLDRADDDVARIAADLQRRAAAENALHDAERTARRDRAAEAARSEEAAAWEKVRDRDVIDDYVAFIRAYPDGRHTDRAREIVQAARARDDFGARLTEERMALSRDARREIQRDLTALGYRANGLDGQIGTVTRSAIADWQRAHGHRVTGYLNAAQIERLRAAARDAPNTARDQGPSDGRGDADADADWWARTGQGGGPDGWQAYLDRYPDGRYADIARTRLDGAGDRASSADARTEAALRLSPDVRAVVERKLQDHGYDPGRVDGTFDASARRAIRAFQRDEGAASTGYLTQRTLDALF